MNFQDKAVAEKYEATSTNPKDDVIVAIGRFKGRLSTVNESTAAQLVKVKDANIRLKENTGVTVPAK